MTSSRTHRDAVASEGCSDPADQRISHLVPPRELIVPIRPPRCHHGKHEDATVAELKWVGECVVLTNRVGGMRDIKLDWPIATRFQVDEAHTARGIQHVADVRFAMQQLLVRAAVDDRLPQALQCVQ